MGFENKLTIRKFMISKRKKAFHESYENAIKNIKSLFGKKYNMVIDGKCVKSSETFVHTSPD